MKCKRPLAPVLESCCSQLSCALCMPLHQLLDTEPLYLDAYAAAAQRCVCICILY